MKKKLLASILTGLLIVGALPAGASAAWKQDSTGWWYGEGNSYATGWKNINGLWYYFYSGDGKYACSEMKGYMAYDTIVDGFYLNSNGVWTNTKEEKREYEGLLRNEEWLAEHTDFERNGQIRNIILDINQDGISEMLLFWGESSGGLGGKKISVVTYNNGKVNVQDLDSNHGMYYGYSNSEKIFFISGGTQGNSYINGYKLENSNCEKVFSATDNVGRYGEENATYVINGEKVSKAEYDKSFEKFGKIDKSQVGILE